MYCGQAQLERISPGSKIIYIDSVNKNYQHYLNLSNKKNKEFEWFCVINKEEFLDGCNRLHAMYPTAYCVNADAFFKNQSDCWYNLKKFLDVDFDVDVIMAEHANYLLKQN
jgi:hypothetical protein